MSLDLVDTGDVDMPFYHGLFLMVVTIGVPFHFQLVGIVFSLFFISYLSHFLRTRCALGAGNDRNNIE